MSITQEYLRSLFDYEDGNLYWKVKRNGVKPDKKAGNHCGNGYFGIMIDDKGYKLHRMIFLFHHGYLPKYLDHKDGNRGNNRIENLRECTHQENIQNRAAPKNNTTGIKNVVWVELRKRWLVKVKHANGIYYKHLKCLELADLVATEARDKFHGKFANHGVQP
jgi:hypothetical protein